MDVCNPCDKYNIDFVRFGSNFASFLLLSFDNCFVLFIRTPPGTAGGATAWHYLGVLTMVSCVRQMPKYLYRWYLDDQNHQVLQLLSVQVRTSLIPVIRTSKVNINNAAPKSRTSYACLFYWKPCGIKMLPNYYHFSCPSKHERNSKILGCRLMNNHC